MDKKDKHKKDSCGSNYNSGDFIFQKSHLSIRKLINYFTRSGPHLKEDFTSKNMYKC